MFGLEGVRGRINAKKVFVKSVTVLGASFGIMVLGSFISMVCSSIAGVPFKLFGTVQGVMFDNAAMIVSAAAMVVVTVLIYVVSRKKTIRQHASRSMRDNSLNAARNHAYNVLYGTLALLLVLSAVLLVALGENMMFFIPLTFATVAMILYHMTNLRVWLVVAIGLILLHVFSFYYALAMALTIGALGAVLMLSFFALMVILPLADIYMMPARKK